MKIPIYQVDAFTNKLFKGNPAAICVLDSWIDDELMQKIAKENNLSETAFFTKNGAKYDLRWFTPVREVSLCGHATLASAFIIFNFIEKDITEIEFNTKSGILTVSKAGDMISMIFPSRELVECEVPECLVKGLGKMPVKVLKTRSYLAVFEKEEDIRNLNLNMEELKKLDLSGVIVTAKGNEADFVSRYFAPGIGLNEDPVTGSAHCTLVPYWKKILNKTQFTAYQLSERSGILYCTDMGDNVKISGEAVLFSEGFINI